MAEGNDSATDAGDGNDVEEGIPAASQHHSLKYHLLGPSLTKSGQDSVDQKKVSEVIYNASKGSKFFNNEERKDGNLTGKIENLLARKRELQRVEENGGLRAEQHKADERIAALECERDLSQAVVHIDCDAFYAAVEELDRPELKDVPFAVGIGVLTTCNYVARKYGCRSAMAGFVARKLCPQLVQLPLNFEKYTAKAREVRAILADYDPRFESSSIDEAYLNITAYCEENGVTPEEAVTELRSRVRDECGITVSAGIAANARLAKICSNKNKPDGQFVLPPERGAIMSFMRDLQTRKVTGIGRVLERELDAIGVKTCGDIYDQRQYLRRLFGDKAFEFLMLVHLGLGRTQIRPAGEYERKSVGTESTFHDISSPADLRAKLRRTAEELERDLRRTQFKGRTLVLKIKLHTYEVFTRQVQPPKAVFTADELYQFSLPMLAKLEKDMPGMKLRLMGLRCTNLVSTKKGGVDFFGRAQTRTTLPGSTTPEKLGITKLDDEGWEVWPDDGVEIEALQDEPTDLERRFEEAEVLEYKPDGTPTDFRRYGNGFAWRSILEMERAKEEIEEEKRKAEDAANSEQWTCPICSLPQLADERAFNEHIDLCLSRQTIKDIVKAADVSAASETRPASTARGKRSREADPTAVEGRVRRPFFT